MCYSAEIQADYKKYVRAYGAHLSIEQFYDIFWRRLKGEKIKVPKAVEAWFAQPQTEDERRIKALIDQYNAQQATRLEQELFKQRKRLADAERELAVKTTKAASEHKRIAGSKVEQILGWLADLRRTEPRDEDARIFPGHHAPVIVGEGGRRVIRLMRYQCRPAGRPALFDRRFPGTYNARRDNLEGFWKDLFGLRHGVMVVTSFYENVSRHKVEHRELREGESAENVVLQFKPQQREDMLVACLWSHWKSQGEPDLESFAAITDEPPQEVAAAGHDRCIVPLKPENVGDWLQPQHRDLGSMYALLDDRWRPYYEHRMAA